MAKTLLACSLLLSLVVSLPAQQTRTSGQQVMDGAERAPAQLPVNQIQRAGEIQLLNPSVARMDDPQNPNAGISMNAMWDVEFVYSASDSIRPTNPMAGLAGAYWVDSAFWVSRWNSDTLIRLDTFGRLIEIFTIPGLSGVRSLTSDGTNLYAGRANATIAVINPITRTLTSSIPITGAASTIGSRFLTYDPTLDGGNGGFYIGNFTSAIGVLNKTGGTITTIPAATHGRVGMYGAAVDNISAGGPYLWVFEQAGTPSQGVISQLQLPAGTFTGVQRDANADVGGTAGLAGGLFIATNHPAFPGQNILGGLLQNGPDLLFGYDLDFNPIQVDANLRSLITSNGLTQIPQDHVAPITYSSEILNQGAQSLTSATITVSVDSGSTNLFLDSETFANVAPGTTAAFTSDPFTPPAVPGTVFSVSSEVSLAGQSDENTINDSTGYFFLVSDSTFARDNNTINVLIDASSFNAGGKTIFGNSYTLTNLATVTSVSAYLFEPAVGDSTYGVLWATDPATGTPLSQISRTPAYVFTTADSLNGVFVTLPFTTQIPLPPNTTFMVGVVEQQTTRGLTLAASRSIFTPNTIWVKSDSLGGGAWFASENFWVDGEWAPIVRANLSYCVSFDAIAGAVQDNGGGSGSAFALASGGTSPYTYSWSNGASTDTALFLAAGFYNVTITDARGCAVSIDSVEVIDNTGIEEQLAGIDALNAFPNPSMGRFSLEIELAAIDDLRISIMDVSGRVIYAKAENRVQRYNEQIDLGNQSRGVYVLRVQTSKGIAHRRLIVE